MTGPTIRCPVCSEALPAQIRYEPLPPDGSLCQEVRVVDPDAWAAHVLDHPARRLSVVR